MKPDFSWSSAVLAGFGVLRREPGVLLLWGLVGMAFGLLDQILEVRVEVLRTTGYSATWSVPMLGLTRGVLATIVMAILSAAVYRVVLWPRRQARDAFRGRTRFGADEVRLTLIWLLQGVLLIVLAIAALIPAFALSTLTAKQDATVTGVVGTFIAVGILIAWIALLLRLSLAAPMSLAQGRWSVPAAWRMTRGHAWKILAVHLPILLGLALVFALSDTLYSLALFATQGGAAPVLPGRSHSLAEALAPARLGFTVVTAMLGAIAAAMLYAPAAFIYRALNREEPADQAAVFD
jgi:hypothetical protein